ncbi:MAG: PHP domain-containing protein, partial [Myxococcales bacterium]|nr:PHP domain-containing protein [Myxococcales bacterium]
MTAFTHLHLHSQYSLLTGAIRMADLPGRVVGAGMNAVAVTDQGNLFGAIDFYKRAKKAGIKAILGAEVLVADGSHLAPRSRKAWPLVLLARDAGGFANLRTLISKAWLNGLHNGRPHIDHDLLRLYRDGLFGLSAHHEGEIARAVLEGRHEQARELAAMYRDLFEPGSFYLEVVPSGVTGQAEVNAENRKLGTELSIPLVATNHVHYLDRKDARAHEVLLCIGAGRTLDDPDRPRYDVDSLWLKPPETMWAEMGDEFADALENTQRIAEQCETGDLLRKPMLPSAPIDEPGYTADTWLAERARRGLEERFAEFARIDKTVDRPVYHARLEEEIGIIQGMGFPGYFLIVQDFINWAKRQDI